MEGYPTTEDDWAWSHNIKKASEDQDEYYIDSPLILGRHSIVNKCCYGVEEEDEDYSNDPTPKLESSYLMESELEPQIFQNQNNLPNTPPSMAITIRKRIHKAQNRKRAQFNYKQFIKDIVQEGLTNKDIFKQLEQCQQIKQFIDKLEGILIDLKSIIITKMQSQSEQ